MYWYLKVLKQYFDFSGRARRKEYWMFCLFSWIFYLILCFIDYFFLYSLIEKYYISLLGDIYCLLVFIPTMAVCVRRFHDINKSGWTIIILSIFYLLMFINQFILGYIKNAIGINNNIFEVFSLLYLSSITLFFIISLGLIYYQVKRGDIGDNKYGSDPKRELNNLKV